MEAVLKTDHEDLLTAIETIVDQNNASSKRTKGRFGVLLGSLTREESESIKKTIEEDFGKINPDNRK